MESLQKPSVGRIVHYVSYGTPGGEYLPEHRAAIITNIGTTGEDGRTVVGLCVLNPTGMFFNLIVNQDEVEKKSGTWHWPERV